MTSGDRDQTDKPTQQAGAADRATGSPLPPAVTAHPQATQDITPTLTPDVFPRARPGRVEPGQTLGQYQIESRLGEGGMGTVYKARHATMDRLVALKVLAPHMVSDERARLRFLREARSFPEPHPNIITAHDAVVDGETCYLVMEFVEGADVASLLERHGRPPLGVACDMVRQAALGLQHAHELRLGHRDIKPANLMVTVPRSAGSAAATRPDGWPANPVVKILDCGLARPPAQGLAAPNAITREGTTVGTPEYMAPEQATDSSTADIRSDIYSLGCTLSALLDGRPPFTAPTIYEILAKHLRVQPERIEKRRPDVPPNLAAVVHRMLAKDPDERFQTPQQVADALRPWCRKDDRSRSSTAVIPPESRPAAPAAAPAPTATVRNRPTVSVTHYHTEGISLVTVVTLALVVAILALLGWWITNNSDFFQSVGGGGGGNKPGIVDPPRGD